MEKSRQKKNKKKLGPSAWGKRERRCVTAPGRRHTTLAQLTALPRRRFVAQRERAATVAFECQVQPHPHPKKHEQRCRTYEKIKFSARKLSSSKNFRVWCFDCVSAREVIGGTGAWRRVQFEREGVARVSTNGCYSGENAWGSSQFTEKKHPSWRKREQRQADLMAAAPLSYCEPR